MTKDDMYYIRRLRKAAEERDAKTTAGKTPDEIYAILDELNAESSPERLARIGQNQNQAFAIIRLMIDEPYTRDAQKFCSLGDGY